MASSANLRILQLYLTIGAIAGRCALPKSEKEEGKRTKEEVTDSDERPAFAKAPAGQANGEWKCHAHARAHDRTLPARAGGQSLP